MKQGQRNFGGDWTTEKLERVRKYLAAYTTIMNKYPFHFAYIDAFAGTGYRKLKQDENPNELMFPEIAEQEVQDFLEGSASTALQVQPRFQKYIFIEKDENRSSELQNLKTEFPSLQNDIELVQSDANAYLKDLCLNRNWKKHRAVLFLDPYGMEVEWNTITAIAKTQAIDLWLLFPLGVAVNRLLKRDGNIDTTVRHKLDRFFGTTDWYDAFYETIPTQTLFGKEMVTQKTGDFKSIEQYFVKRLQTVFTKVANNPLPLYNSRNNPLYLLCFAAGNPKGASTAVKIAQDILRK
ncbi:three-Cys-motif partner protein TcmP [Candidatus Poribacteria bacterium]|nr:three-Cys-motif partner protein TcmP [Candidatus Poribacteria bacterium]